MRVDLAEDLPRQSETLLARQASPPVAQNKNLRDKTYRTCDAHSERTRPLHPIVTVTFRRLVAKFGLKPYSV